MGPLILLKQEYMSILKIGWNAICLSFYQFICLFTTLSNEKQACWPHCISHMCILSRIECKKVELRFAFPYVNISAYLLPLYNERQVCWPNRPYRSICRCILSKIECKKVECDMPFFISISLPFSYPFVIIDKIVGLKDLIVGLSEY